MQAKRTLFIVGAGASCEYGLPAGNTLTSHIAQALRFANNEGDDTIRHALVNEFGNDAGRAFQSANEMSAALPLASSIDRYLDVHSQDEAKIRAGKLGIARCILEAERNSSLCFVSGNSIEFDKEPGRAGLHRPIDSWLGVLFKLLQEGVKREDPEGLFRNIVFVSFNYDRCIEHFFYHATRLLLGLSHSETSKALSALAVHHPYGSMGDLPWQAGEGSKIEFGQRSPDPDTLRRVADGIKTFTEQVSAGDVLHSVREEVRRAERLAFLGFGFHAQNMDLLQPATQSQALEAFATTFGQSGPDSVITQEAIRKCLSGTSVSGGFDPRRIHLSSTTAQGFMIDRGRHLQLG